MRRGVAIAAMLSIPMSACGSGHSDKAACDNIKGPLAQLEASFHRINERTATTTDELPALKSAASHLASAAGTAENPELADTIRDLSTQVARLRVDFATDADDSADRTALLDDLRTLSRLCHSN
jgi:hypothetical protein